MSRKHKTLHHTTPAAQQHNEDTSGQQIQPINEQEPVTQGFPWQFVALALVIMLGLLSIVLSSLGVL